MLSFCLLSFFLSFTCECRSVFKRGKNENLTPVLAFLLNLPPGLRTTFAGILLCAVMPSQLKDYDALLEYVLRQWTHMLEGGEGIDVWDAHTQTKITVWIRIVFMVEDSQGLKNPLCCKGIGSIIGGCPFCQIEGLPGSSGSRCYPCAITHLPRNNRHPEAAKYASLRREWITEFKNWPEYKALASVGPPTKMTRQKALASAKLLNEKKIKEVQASYKQKPALSKVLGPDWDFTSRVLNDVAHAVYNAVCNVFSLVANDGKKMKWNPKRARVEKNHGRFQEVSGTTTKY